MGTIAIDRAGDVNGRLTVLGERRKNDKGFLSFLCRCECGNELWVGITNIRRQKSCAACRCKTITKHGASGDRSRRLYSVWLGMKNRCDCPNSRNYHRYGGRGIKICSAWYDFSKFESDMLPGYAPGLEIERVDNNGNYEKSNCRWATRMEQCNNTCRSVFVEHEGVRLTITQWAKKLGVDPNTLKYRIFVSKWPISEALSVSPKSNY